MNGFSEKEISVIVDMMTTQPRYVNRRKIYGSDGIHPSWILEYDIDNVEDLAKVKTILSSSIQKTNFFSTHLVLIPKKTAPHIDQYK